MSVAKIVLRYVSASLCLLVLGFGWLATAHAQSGESQQVQRFLDELLGLDRKKPKATPRSNNGNGRIILRTPESQTPLGENDSLRADGGADKVVPQSQPQMQLSFAPLVKNTSPSVVNIFADRIVRNRSPFAGDPFFEQFFGRGLRGEQRMENSLGSGVIVGADGIIITNNHVVANADQIRVVIEDGREFEAQLVTKDEDSDLAVLRIRVDEQLPTLKLANSDQLEVGDLVLAIGNPFGVGKTVTSGIVSALARARVQLSDFGFFIQTDAAINPGNSGGALIDMDGNLVGINTAIFSRSGGSNGIGFAIPSNMVRAVLRSADGSGSGQTTVARPYMGAQFEPVTNDIAAQLGMRAPRGALLVGIDPNGPAAKAGLRAGDVLLVIENTPINSPDELNYRLYTAGAGSKLSVQALRRRRILDFNIVLEKDRGIADVDNTAIEGRTPFAGAKVAEANRRLLQSMRVRTDNPTGVVVTEVERGSTATRFLERGDFIRAVNGVEIRTVEDLRKVVSRGGRNWRYTLERSGSIIRQFVRS